MAQLEPRDEPTVEDARNPVRVFLLSDNSLLREIIPAAFKRYSTILLVGTHPASHHAVAEILESACDVLLVDASNEASSFETSRVLATLKRMRPDLKSVTMCMDHGIAELISSIRLSFAEENTRIESVQPSV